MHRRKLKIGLLGASGAVGREILALLEEDEDIPVAEVHLVASPSSSTDRLEFRGRQVRVLDPDLDALSQDDVVVVALPPKAARTLVPALRKRKVPLVDLSGTLDQEAGVPRVVARVNGHSLGAFRDERAVASPRPLVVTLATLLAPLVAQGGTLQVRGTALHAAGVRGRAGIEELSGQVVAMFNSRPPPRKVFPGGLAFDLVPALGTLAEDGWSDEETCWAGQVAQILGQAPTTLSVTSMVAPWFTGLGLSLHLLPEREMDVDDVESTLSRAEGIQLAASTLPDALPNVGATREDVRLHVGRIRADRSGVGIHLWAVADEVRFGAAANVLSILSSLSRDGLLPLDS